MKSDELIQQLGRKMKHEGSSKVRSLLVSVWALVPFFLMGFPLLYLGLRSDIISGGPAEGLSLYILGLFGTAFCTLYYTWVSGIPGRKPSAWIRYILSLAVVCIAAGVYGMARGTLERESLAAGLDTWGLRCSRVEVSVIVLPSLLFFVLFRKLAPTRPALTGGLGLLALGSISALVLSFHCNSNHPVHIMLWHLIPILILSLLGTIAGRKLLRW